MYGFIDLIVDLTDLFLDLWIIKNFHPLQIFLCPALQDRL